MIKVGWFSEGWRRMPYPAAEIRPFFISDHIRPHWPPGMRPDFCKCSIIDYRV